MKEQHELRRSENSTALKSYEFKFCNKHDEIRDILLVVDVIPNTKRSVASLMDITERKQMEMEARESRLRFKSLFDQAADGILVGDHSGKILEANNNICYLTGYSRNELVGSNINKLFNTKELLNSPLRYDLVHQGKNVLKERILTCKNGKEIHVEMSTKHLTDGRLQAIFRDISERKKVQNDLIIAKEKAEESDRLKTAFLANMSHEIRTPMNSILGFVNLLSIKDISPDIHQKYLNVIKKSGQRLLQTVNDLIDISRIETGQVELVLAPMDVKDELKMLFDIFEPESKNKGIRLNMECDLIPSESIVQTDQIKLHSILINLIKNAIKYTNQGQIEFGCVLKESFLQFYIHDTGIGIPLDRQKAIFNRFEQADIEDSRAMEGSGLGLAIAKAYVEMLGGQIWLESKENRGSSFYFTIYWNPIQFNEIDGNTTIENPDSSSNTKKLKILIVEDDEVSYEYLSILIGEFTREIIHTNSGLEAIEMCKSNSDIDLVLMDIKMTEMGGYKATEEIRKFNTSVPIIAQTAYALNGDREKALAAGCTDYISKPISEELLIELIRRHTQ
jgi:PAS domain S-box-containing protein